MSITEIIGFIFGVAGIWLTMRENTWCFPIGLVNVIVSLVLFFSQKLYSDCIQQIVYILLLSYGWYKWLIGENKKSELKISFSSNKLLVILLSLCILFSLAAGFMFEKYTDASLPYWDASATALSFTAQWMIARKKIENWLLWMIVNSMYVGIYLYKDLLLYAVLFFIYFLLAVKGWMEWKKKYQKI